MLNAFVSLAETATESVLPCHSRVDIVSAVHMHMCAMMCTQRHMRGPPARVRMLLWSDKHMSPCILKEQRFLRQVKAQVKVAWSKLEVQSWLSPANE